jgi:hypothetical protein
MWAFMNKLACALLVSLLVLAGASAYGFYLYQGKVDLLAKQLNDANQLMLSQPRIVSRTFNYTLSLYTSYYNKSVNGTLMNETWSRGFSSFVLAPADNASQVPNPWNSSLSKPLPVNEGLIATDCYRHYFNNTMVALPIDMLIGCEINGSESECRGSSVASWSGTVEVEYFSNVRNVTFYYLDSSGVILDSISVELPA